MKETAILLCTYNSSRFLQEQMDSLLRQTYQDWKLYVRDDQSEDDTVAIVQGYAANDQRIIMMDDHEKRGAKNGFMWLLSHVEADYYLFCDHDDIWEPTKIAASIALMEQTESATPAIVCSDLTIIDAASHPTASSFWQQRHFSKALLNDKYFHLVFNNIPGCSMLINNAAKQCSLPYSPDIEMHDAWIAASVLWHDGRILTVDEPQIRYRIHEGNTVGAKKVPSIVSQLLIVNKLFIKVKRQFRSTRCLHHMSFLAFLNIKLKYMLSIHLNNIK